MSDISEHIAGVAEDIENADELGDVFDPLEINYKVTERGDVQEVYAVLTTGGPYVEVRCLGGTIFGAWGDTHTTHVRSDELEAFGESLARQMEARIE